jgi:multicomponent Na+:H+ antiporter subunit E
VVPVSATGLLVPVSESVTLRNTVAYAVRRAREGADDAGPGTVHFVYPLSERQPADGEAAEARELLDRVTVWADEDLGDAADEVAVETVLVGENEYLFSPDDYATVIARYLRENDLDAVVLDPEFNPVGTTPLLPPIAAELRRTGVAVSEAPVERERRGGRLVRRGTLAQLLALFAISYAFYVLLAGSLDRFELVTGAITAGVVSLALWQVSLTGPVRPLETGVQLLRMLVYAPYLLWEIAKANLHIAYVVLHPSLPIDPEMVEFDAAVWSPLPVTTLANSITLTPGTLTVDATRRHFTVHTLTKSSREDLLEGGLERAVRFVYYGRRAARIANPASRGEDGASGGPEGGEES